MDHDAHKERDFPISAGLLFGLGLGGFFDGIVLHQVLQWHHMLTSAGYPANSVPNLEVNTLWDGFFHLSTYVFVVLGLFILFRYLLQSQSFRDSYDQVKLAIPVIGPLVRKLAVARFSRSFAALYSAGISIPESLVASAEAANNAVLERRVRAIAPTVETGGSLTQLMVQTGFFPSMYTGMVATGEQTGNLDGMLDKAAEFYENEGAHASMQPRPSRSKRACCAPRRACSTRAARH